MCLVGVECFEKIEFMVVEVFVDAWLEALFWVAVETLYYGEIFDVETLLVTE